MDLTGAAQYPAHEDQIVRKHPAGHRRARRIAIENGVPIDEGVRIFREKEEKQLAGTNAHACYLSLRGLEPNDIVRFEELFPGGRASVTMHRSVFLSDESIVAHLAHELHEVRGLKEAFAEAGGGMRFRDFKELIRAGKKGNLHDQAWDEANRVVEVMRARSRPTMELPASWQVSGGSLLDGGISMNRSVKNLLRIHRFDPFPEPHLFSRFVDYALTDPLEELMTSIPPEYWPRFRDGIDGFLPHLDELIHPKTGDPLPEPEKATIRALAEWLHQHLGQGESAVPEAGAALNGPSEAGAASALSERGSTAP